HGISWPASCCRVPIRLPTHGSQRPLYSAPSGLRLSVGARTSPAPVRTHLPPHALAHGRMSEAHLGLMAPYVRARAGQCPAPASRAERDSSPLRDRPPCRLPPPRTVWT